jgi:hypothetical protein
MASGFKTGQIVASQSEIKGEWRDYSLEDGQKNSAITYRTKCRSGLKILRQQPDKWIAIDDDLGSLL